MAKSVYTGIDGIAHKVKKLYVGVDGIARKVKKGYIGVDGVARLFYSGFPEEPTEYVLLDSITSSTTFTAPVDGWYQIELFGRSGAGGNSTYYNEPNYNTNAYWRVVYGGGGGGGAYCCSNKIKLHEGDTIEIVIGTTCTVTILSSTGESYPVMTCTTGTNGGNGTGSGSSAKNGTGGSGGTASGGNVSNLSGSAGVTKSYIGNLRASAYTTLNGNAPGASGGATAYTGGNVGGTGAGYVAYKNNESDKVWNRMTTVAAGSAKSGFVKIYGGNTNEA